MADTDIKPGEPRKSSVLIVDDAPRNLQVLVNILREQDCKISVATSGRKALEIIEHFQPDLILLDIMMPQMDGFQVCKILKDSPKTKDIPIIFLTARTETENIVKGFDLGAVDYITKPFNRAELLARIKTHLGLRKAQKAIICLEQKNAALAVAVTAKHEINQPLTVLQGNFERFRASTAGLHLTEQQQQFLTRIKESIERIQAILKKMSNSTALHFENYLGDIKMVVYDEENNKRVEDDILTQANTDI
jgi:two-component system sensor histidine kinase/response regulator